jgi:hypothetical protein
MISSPGSASDCADERDPLRRTRQHQDVARIDRAAARAHAQRDRFAQRRVAFAIAVGEDEVHVAARAFERPRQVASGDGSAGGTPCTKAIRSPCSLAASSPSTDGN